MNWALLGNSMVVAGLSTLVSLALGFIVALVMAALPKPLRNVLLGLCLAVLALPSFLVTNCWIDLLGVDGVPHRWLPLSIFSLGGAVWILALTLWPISALAAWSAWQKLEPVQFEVDPALRGVKLLRYLLLPAAKSNLIVSAVIVFALALSNFSVPTILQVKVFTSEMWIQFNTNLDARAALWLSWPLLVLPIAMLLFLSRNPVPWPSETQSDIATVAQRQLGSWFMVAVGLSAATLVLSLATPLVQLTATPRTWTEFMPAFVAGRSAALNSIVYSAAGAGLAVVFGLLLARVRGLGWLWLLFFLPGVLLGIGAVTAFNHPALDLFTRTAAIVIALLVVRYVALARSISRAALLSIDADLLDAARLDGARGLVRWRRIVLPLVARPVTVAGYIVYVLCLWDVETILLVIPPGGDTLALRIFNFLHYGHNAHVNALCVLLLALAIAPLVALPLLRLVLPSEVYKTGR